MRALDRPYQLQRAGDSAHAVFRVEGAVSFATSATLLGDVMRLTAHELIEGDDEPERLWRLNDLNHRWAVGRVYLDRDRGAFELAVAAWAHGIDAKRARSMLEHLERGAAAVGTMQVPPMEWSPHDGAATRLVSALEALELSPLERGDGIYGVRQAIGPGLDLVLELSCPAERLLVVRARRANPTPVGRSDAVLATLQVINRGLPIGCVSVDQESELAIYSIGVPLDWRALELDHLRWLIRQAVSVLRSLDGAW